jgi:hypothetical protein
VCGSGSSPPSPFRDELKFHVEEGMESLAHFRSSKKNLKIGGEVICFNSLHRLMRSHAKEEKLKDRRLIVRG